MSLIYRQNPQKEMKIYVYTNENICLHKNLYTNVPTSRTTNSQKVKAAQMSINL